MARRRWLVCLLLLLAACDARSGRDAPPPRPNIIFILIDTLRADRLGVQGGVRNSPTLDGIAAEGVMFKRAVAQAPWTQPSMASLFSSLYPSVHGVLDYNLAFGSTYRGKPKVSVFSDSFTTLAEALRAGGYATAAFVANPFMVKEYGFAQGFDDFDASFAKNTTPGSVINDAALAWLDRRKDSRPLFMYLHYMDVHGPYDAREEFLDPLLDEVERLPRKQALTPEQMDDLGYLLTLPASYSDRARHERLARYREYWMARYTAGVSEVDHQLAVLRDGLRARGLWDQAYVIVTSDHGEALCEHGLWDHGRSVHDTELHVPLIFRWPGALKPRQVDATARLIDVMPTLIEQLRLPAVSGLQGTSLVADLDGEPPRAQRISFAEGVKLGAEQHAVYSGEWKLMFTVGTDRYQLYNVNADPLEQGDLAGARPVEVARLRSLIERQAQENVQLAADHTTQQVEPNAEQLERLRSLGYVK